MDWPFVFRKKYDEMEKSRDWWAGRCAELEKRMPRFDGPWTWLVVTSDARYEIRADHQDDWGEWRKFYRGEYLVGEFHNVRAVIRIMDETKKSTT